MSIQVKLHIEEQSFEIQSFEFNLFKGLGGNGRPTTSVQGGLFHLVVKASKKSSFFYKWAIDSTLMKKQLKLAFRPLGGS